MTRADELNAEIRNQAVRLYPKCAGLFELPLMVYTQIVADNLTRSKPYRLSVERCKKLFWLCRNLTKKGCKNDYS